MSQFTVTFRITSDVTSGVVRERLLHDSLRESDAFDTSKFESVVTSGGELILVFSKEPTVAERTAITKLVQSHDPLPVIKSELIAQISSHTRERILEGVEYPPGSGFVLSMSETAQLNWTNVHLDPSAMPYPFTAPNKDDTAFVEIKDATEAERIYQTMKVHKLTQRGRGTAAKQAVLSATTIADAQGVADAYLKGSS